MLRLTPRITRIDTPFPHTTLFRSAPSEAGRLVTNGMSQYSRNERNANAGIVVGISPEDYPGGVDAGPLAGIALQEELESRAYVLGGSNYEAPARSEEHTSELQSLMRISYAVFCLKKKIKLRSYEV